ncbi:HNH endonuclease [Stenotrophomonas maltophilia]|uniref:HNH endonuclease n=1 Tax=Stenotrophomonas maltophilia TaxID=40324 RepID=UPI003D7E9187
MIIEVEPGYGVDAAGVVYCCRPINGKGSKRAQWRVVKGLPCSGGRYLQVAIDGKKHLVHRLVARVFHGAAMPGQEVAHINGDGHDNRSANLMYVSHAANEAMKQLHGTAPNGARNGAAVLDESSVRTIRRLVRGGGRGIQRRMAEQFGVSEAAISMVVTGRRWAGSEQRECSSDE